MKNGSISPSNSAEPQNEESTFHGCTKGKRKKMIIAVLVIGILILVAGLFYLGFSVKVETCTSSQCTRTATEVRRHIDTRANPCDDFYRFSCGNFLQNTQSQDNRGGSRSVEDITREDILLQIRNLLDKPIQTEDPKAFNVAKKFYRACLNESAIADEGLKKIKEIFELIGGWPTLEGSNWKEAAFDWTEAVHKLRELGLNFNVFFRVSVGRDLEVSSTSSSRYVLSIHEIPFNELEPSTEFKSLIFEYMVELSVRLGANRLIAQEDSKEVLRLYQELAKIYKESHRGNRSEDEYERLALSELQYKYPDIKWHHYINGILKPVKHFNYDDEVILMQPRYIQFMEHFLGITSKRSLANIIAWHTMEFLVNYMPSEFVERGYELVERLNSKMMNLRVPRWRTCVSETNLQLSSVISAAYIQNFFPEDTRYKVLTMVRAIKKQFEENLLKLDWMDYETKELIIQTLHTSGEQLPSYGDLLNLLDKNKIFGEVLIDQSKYLEAALKLNLIIMYQEMSKLREFYEEDPFSDMHFVTGLEIKYSPETNVLTFPVGIFGGVYYQNERPEYMNYGILGSIIAHEISHIFMRARHGDSPRGELKSWWSTNSLANYDEKLQCLSNQYGHFKVAEFRHKHLNLTKTREEDMADLAGLKISYDTYVNWVHENGAQPLLPGLNYSPNQMFWISAAFRHCSKDSPEGMQSYNDNYRRSPSQLRVNGPLQNLKEFVFDFGCKPGSRMNPENKCDVW